MKTTSRILLLLGSEEENDTQIALGLGLRLAKVQPVELYSDQASFAPPNRRLYCHRCTIQAGHISDGLFFPSFKHFLRHRSAI